MSIVRNKIIENYWLEKVENYQVLQHSSEQVNKSPITLLDEEKVIYFNKITNGDPLAKHTIIVSIFSLLIERYFSRLESLVYTNDILNESSSKLLLHHIIQNGNFTFKEYLNTAKNEIQESFSYSDYNETKLSEKIDGKKLSDYSHFGLSAVNTQEIDCNGLLLEVQFSEEGCITFNFQYKSSFTQSHIVSHLQKNLEKIICNLKSIVLGNVNQVELLNSAEIQQLVTGFNDTKVDYAKNKTLVDLFEEQVDRGPEDIALIYEKKEFTYQELNKKANQFGAYLREKYNIQKDDLIGIKLERSEWMIISIFGILKSGAAYVPIDPEYPQERVNYIKKDTQCKVIVNEEELTVFLSQEAEYSTNNLQNINSSNDLAYVIYTSGTTGNPKGVMIEHTSLVNRLSWMQKAYPISQKDVLIQKTTYTFDVSVWELLWWAVYGAKISIPKSGVEKDLGLLVENIHKNKVTVMHFVPSMLSLFLEYLKNNPKEKQRLNSLKQVFVSGEALTLSQREQFYKQLSNISLMNLYGPTEASIDVSYYDCSQSHDLNSIPIGKPIDNTQLFILTKNLGLTPIGVLGNLYISGVGLSRGYINKTELTSEKFIENPFINGAKMYDTGDLARWLPDGNIEFLGREDSQVKIRGQRVELGEIENNLLQYSKDIKQVVVEIKEFKEEKVLAAYYVSSKSTINKSDIRSYLQERLPEYMIPNFYIVLDRIPLTANGKIDRKALSSVGQEDIMRREYVAPNNKTEQKLTEIWQEVLGVEKIGIADSFFELGGHSLMVGQIINRISKELNKKITVKEFFEQQTIEKITIALSENSNYSKITKIPIKDSYKLHPSQERMWLLSQMEGGSIAYNMPIAIKIKGTLISEKFKEAFHNLIAQHEILRTYFKVNEQGQVRQYIIPEEELKQEVEFKDFSLEKKQKEVLDQYLFDRNNESFNLEEPPLVRASLIKTNKDEFVFFLSMHHIIGDGWSTGILIAEIIENYKALLNKKERNLATERVDYKDYVVWFNKETRAKPYQEAKRYWLSQFEGEIPVLDLPAFRTRPAFQSFKGGTLKYRYSKEFLEKLKSFSSQQDVTLFMVLMAGVNILLNKYTNQNEIIVGTPIATRDHQDLEDQIGLFLNTIAIRTSIAENNSFSALLGELKETLIKGYEHAIYPFDQLVSNLDIRRDTSRAALFDVMVVLQNQEQLDQLNHKLETIDLTAENYEFDRKVSQFDINFVFVESDSLDLIIEYNTEIYDSFLIERIFMHLEQLFLKVVSRPNTTIGEINLLTNQEEHYLLKELNKTGLEYPSNKTVIDLFEKQVERTPNQIALVFENTQLTYKELSNKITQLSSHLRSLEVDSDTIIGVCLDRSINMLIGILGILKSGAAYLPIDPFYPIDRMDYILSDSNTKYVLVNNQTKKILPENISAINLDENIVWRAPSNMISDEILSSSPAYVIYTSGSTGKPKGVKVSHKNLVNFIEGLNYKFGKDTAPNNWLAVTSISFDISILELLWPLTKGDKVVIHLERPVVTVPKPDMDFSLFYFPTKQSEAKGKDKYKLLLEGAKYGDENGFKAVWAPERHFHNFGDQFPNPSVAIAAVSTITKQITLRSGSVVLPLHDPVRVAEEWSMIDNLSDGRVELSIASGWHPNDFVLAPNDYNDRHKKMKEGITTLKHLWKGNSLTRKNGIGKDYEFWIHPKPVQDDLPLWITAAGSIDTFKYAGSIGANILTHLLGQSTDDLKEKITIYRQSLQENGFDPEKGKVALMLHTFVGIDSDNVKSTVEEPFKNYLRNSINLIKPIAEEQGLNVEDENDIEIILDAGFLRFYKTGSLFGTPEMCLGLIHSFYEIGVNEIACLIDFGIDEDIVLSNLCHLNRLKELVRRSKLQDDFINVKMKQINESQNTASLIKKHKITHLQSTPSFYEGLLLDEEGKESLKGINNLLVGGEELKRSLGEKLVKLRGKPIHNMYGPTETTIWSSIKTVNDENDITIGTPIINTQIYILNKFDKLCPLGVSGELCIGGDGVALGYLNKPELTASKFVDIPLISNQKIYRTGDLARWLPNGELEFLGRLDSQVKISGYRIELKEIENVIAEIHEVSQNIVSTVNNKEQINLVAYLKTTNKSLDKNYIKDFLRLRLPNYMIPQHILILDDFPYTPNGKIDIKKLPAPTDVSFEKKNYTGPRNELEKELAGIWNEYLKVKKISIDDNFFEIGGNSMKAVQLLSKINKELDLDLQVITFFRYPTIRLLAKNLTQQEKQEVELVENDMEGADELMDFMQDV